MPNIDRNGFRIHYEVTGPDTGRPLVLVAGLGEQIGSVEYPDEQCEIFAAQGFRVVRLDNRDTGLSVPPANIPQVDIMATLAALGQGRALEPTPYTLLDMADDVAAVLDALGVKQANLMGASLGGYIGRWVALRHPGRILSLHVVMSGSGALPGEEGPQLEPAVISRLAEMSERRERAQAISYLVGIWRWCWGEAYPFEEEWVERRVAAAYARAYRPEGIARQLLAALHTPSLWAAQTEIRCPTLVIHGEQDPCFSGEHGRAIAKRIPGAQLWLDPRMGHTLHREQWREMADRAAALAP
jgi:pimeloyl-ACP methyl ester carboxylesterase